MSSFHPMDFFLLTLYTIHYPQLFLFVLCQYEPNRPPRKMYVSSGTQVNKYPVSIAFENIVPRLNDMEKRLDANVFIPNQRGRLYWRIKRAIVKGKSHIVYQITFSSNYYVSIFSSFDDEPQFFIIAYNWHMFWISYLVLQHAFMSIWFDVERRE